MADNPTRNDTDDADYRYMSSPSGMEIEILISGWHLSLNLSSRFRFVNDVTELSKHAQGSKATTISFVMAVYRDTNSDEYHSPTINELTIKVQDLPTGLGKIVALKSYFQEISTLRSATSFLTLTIDAEPIATSSKDTSPWTHWEYGFDFDLNERALTATNRATHLIFTVYPPGKFLRSCLEDLLRNNEKLKADTFVDLCANRSLRLVHGKSEMWRLAAVGYKAGVYTHLRTGGFGWST